MIVDEINTSMMSGNVDGYDINTGMSIEIIARYLSAGILLPEEVIMAEKIIRRGKIQ